MNNETLWLRLFPVSGLLPLVYLLKMKIPLQIDIL